MSDYVVQMWDLALQGNRQGVWFWLAVYAFLICGYSVDALYSYQVDGKTYQGKRISPWIIVASHNVQFVLKHQLAKVETFAGNKVKIFYKPSNPAKSWLILPSKLGVFITFLISLLPAFSYWLAFYG